MARERGENGLKQLKNGKYQIRLTYTDSSGKRVTVKRQAESSTEAKNLKKRLLRELDDNGDKSLDGNKMLFRHLALIYKEKRLFEAQYHGNRKIAGLRSWKCPTKWLETLTGYFGNKRIRAITHSDVETFKQVRLNTVTIKGTRRAISSVNRELELLRAVMRFALGERWILYTPFENKNPLINKSDETRREKTLSFEDEQKFLNACDSNRISTYQRKDKTTGEIKTVTATTNKGRDVLKAIVITALDTAMRRGEIFKLQWKDICFLRQIITIIALNSKTARAREVGFTNRVRIELERLWEHSPKDENGLVFGITSTIKRSFASVCNDAGITDLHFHDLRHTAISRMVNIGLPSSEIMKTTGHTQITTFQRYVNPTAETFRENARRLGEYNAAQMKELEDRKEK